MKNLIFSLAIAFALLFNSAQLKAGAPIIYHNMTSAFEKIEINKEGATINLTINNLAITVTDYTGYISGSPIIWGTHWFTVTPGYKDVKIVIDPVSSGQFVLHQVRVYMKDYMGNDYQFVINQNPY